MNTLFEDINSTAETASRTRERRLRDDRGSVLPTILGLMVVLLTISLGILSLTQRQSMDVVDDSKRQTAIGLAEGGIDHVIWRLRQTADAQNHYGPAWRTLADERDVVLGNGTYYLKQLNTNTDGTIKSVDMQGFVPSRTANGAVSSELVVEVDPPAGSPFEMAVLVKTSMILSGSFYTDSFNSASSSLPTYTPLNNGDIGTLSGATASINIGGNPYIHGAINYPTGSPGAVKTPGAWWTQYEAMQGFTHAAFSSVTVPAGAIDIKPVNDGPIILKPACCNNAYSGPSGENYVQFIRTNGTPVNDNTTLASDGLPYIPAGIYHITANSTSPFYSASVTNNRVLRFGPGVTQLYLDGNLNVANSAKISAIDQKPTSVQIFGTSGCTSVSLSGNTPFIGGLYAPSANVVLGGSCAIYGSLVADRADLSGGGRVIYDEAFGSGSGSGGNNYSISSWTQVK